MMQSTMSAQPRELSLAELNQVNGGVLPGVGVCKEDPKPENSAFGGAMVALAIILLL
jgi:hypothetical protein